MSRETANQLDRLLEPLHGRHGHISPLPPAEVTIDFTAAAATMKAA
ncbi:MAG: hypothetical protein AABN33_25915 [Acidobacteriota bacterium]